MITIQQTEPNPEQLASLRNDIKRSTPETVLSSIVTGIERLVALESLTDQPNEGIMTAAQLHALKVRIYKALEFSGISILDNIPVGDNLLEIMGNIGGMMDNAVTNLIKNKDEIKGRVFTRLSSPPAVVAEMDIKQELSFLSNFWLDREFDADVNEVVIERAQQILDALPKSPTRQWRELFGESQIVVFCCTETQALGLDNLSYPNHSILQSL